jgi:hypothetical protein
MASLQSRHPKTVLPESLKPWRSSTKAQAEASSHQSAAVQALVKSRRLIDLNV